MSRYIEVVRFETDEVVHRVDVTGKSERQVERIEMGMLRNMDLDRFYTREASVNEGAPNE